MPPVQQSERRREKEKVRIEEGMVWHASKRARELKKEERENNTRIELFLNDKRKGINEYPRFMI
jgi:hypothetical protein